jgi:hypothetical protein
MSATGGHHASVTRVYPRMLDKLRDRRFRKASAIDDKIAKWMRQ